MIPPKFIAIGAVAAAALTALAFSSFKDKKRYKKWLSEVSECGKCKKQFTNADLSLVNINELMALYGFADVGSYSFEEYKGCRYCSECAEDIETSVQDRILKANDARPDVRVYKLSYMNDIPKKDCCEINERTVNMYDKPEEAVEELKFMAALKGYDLIYNAECCFESLENRNGGISKKWYCKGTFSMK